MEEQSIQDSCLIYLEYSYKVSEISHSFIHGLCVDRGICQLHVQIHISVFRNSILLTYSFEHILKNLLTFHRKNVKIMNGMKL